LAFYDCRIFGIVNSDLKVEVLNLYENSSRWSEFPIKEIKNKLFLDVKDISVIADAIKQVQ